VSGQGWAAVAGHLAVLHEWSPVYQRWWVHPGRSGDDAVPPWSDTEQARLDRLAVDLDPDQLSEAAERLAAEAVMVEQLAAAVFTAGADAGVGVAAEVGSALADRCAEVAAAVRARAADLSSLAHDLRRAAERVEVWLAELVSLLRRSDGGGGGAYRSPGSAHRDIDDADRLAPGGGSDEARRWPALDGLVERHGGMIAVLRGAMASVESPDSPGAPFPPGAPDGWCGDRGHGAGWPCGAGAWESGWPPPVADVATGPDPVVADRAEQDRVLTIWQPLPLVPRVPGLVDPGGLEPGVGPLLPGTDGDRVGTDTGVRIAQLPDAPAAASRPRR
jgi:hypothetical protein